jgi:glycosyltransferase involved in cell wall biosynthesis
VLVSIPDLLIFCPLPPKPNGIADYLAEQLPYFSAQLSVCVIIENAAPEPENLGGAILVLRLAEYLKCQNQLAAVPHMYHVGNNPDTKYMLPVLLNRPGIVIVHDLNLHYLMDLINLSLGDKQGYTNALFNQYGAAGKIIGQQLSSMNWKGQHMPHELMMNGSVIDAASHIIVHSEYSKNHIAAMTNTAVSVIPHHLSPQTRQFQPKMKMTYRGELGLPGDKTLITSMGFIAKAKQIRAVLTSLKSLKQQGQDFVYILAGQCKPHEYDVYQDIADFDLQDNVIVTGFLSSDDFFKYLVASDFIVNLRYPSGGESSGTLTRAMGLGLACLVVNIGPFAEIPDNCALKINYDDDFDSNLTAALEQLITDHEMRIQVGLNGRRWVASTQEISTTTQAYLAVVEQTAKNTATNDNLLVTSSVSSSMVWLEYLPLPQVREFIRINTLILDGITDKTTHWWAQSMLPMYNNGNLLVVSETQGILELAEKLLGYPNEAMSFISSNNFTQELTQKPTISFEHFAVNLPVRLIESDPVAVFCEINMLLAMGASGCVTLYWDTEIENEVELTRASIITYFEAAGFSVTRFITGKPDIDLDDVNYADNSHQQEWCFALIKCSRMVNTNPQPYYPGAYSDLTLLKQNKLNKQIVTQGDNNVC